MRTDPGVGLAEAGRNRLITGAAAYYSGFTLDPAVVPVIDLEICQGGGTVNLATEAGLPPGGTWSPALLEGLGSVSLVQ